MKKQGLRNLGWIRLKESHLEWRKFSPLIDETATKPLPVQPSSTHLLLSNSPHGSLLLGLKRLRFVRNPEKSVKTLLSFFVRIIITGSHTHKPHF